MGSRHRPPPQEGTWNGAEYSSMVAGWAEATTTVPLILPFVRLAAAFGARIEPAKESEVIDNEVASAKFQSMRFAATGPLNPAFAMLG